VNTHPALAQIVAELAQAAGGQAWIGDSPAGPLENGPKAWQSSGLTAVAQQTGAQLVPFDKSVWKRVGDQDWFIARPALDADLIINLPKLKTHVFMLYSGAVKNMFGVVPGERKRDVHYRAPALEKFSAALIDIFEMVKPGLTILDGILGIEGNGPGAAGTPHPYKCVAAAEDAMALDSVITHAMGYRSGEVLYLAEAARRNLGIANLEAIKIKDESHALEFGPLNLPTPKWYFGLPARFEGPMRQAARVRPRVTAAVCTGCGTCVNACPCKVITPGKPPQFNPDGCIGCLCCVEICPQGAIEVERNWLARMIGFGLSSFGV
jgi:uncharacterized protein (DUF362 family)/NAD-dependent dihydropyrimidine dehydrogenase PreA subunit